MIDDHTGTLIAYIMIANGTDHLNEKKNKKNEIHAGCRILPCWCLNHFDYNHHREFDFKTCSRSSK